MSVLPFSLCTASGSCWLTCKIATRHCTVYTVAPKCKSCSFNWFYFYMFNTEDSSFQCVLMVLQDIRISSRHQRYQRLNSTHCGCWRRPPGFVFGENLPVWTVKLHREMFGHRQLLCISIRWIPPVIICWMFKVRGQSTYLYNVGSPGRHIVLHPLPLYPTVFLWLAWAEEWEDDFDVRRSVPLQSFAPQD